MKGRVVLLALVLVALGGAVARAVLSSRAELRAEATCAALQSGDLARAAADAPTVDAAAHLDGAALRQLGCASAAMLARGDRDGALALLERALADLPAWPSDVDAHLAIPLADAMLARGDRTRAARVMTAAARAAPGDAVVFDYEVQARVLADGAAALDALASDLAGAPADGRTTALADAALGALDPTRALRILGTTAPARPEDRAAWFYARGRALAALKRTDDVIRCFADAEAAGVPHGLAVAEHAAASANAGVADASLDALLDDAMAHESDIADRGLARFLAFKWVQRARMLALPAADVAQRAERAHALFPDLDVSSHDTGDTPRGAGPGLVRFHGDGAFVLAVREEEPARDPERIAFHDGSASITRAGNAPLRYAIVDATGAARGSGVVWPTAHATVDVELPAAPPAKPGPIAQASNGNTRAHGDGHRRVFAVLLDSGDWRVVQLLRARGEMPTVDAMLAHGLRAVVTSEPATTSAALRKIVFPAGAAAITPAQALSDLGQQLAVATGAEHNALAAFLYLAPPDESFFAVLGAHGVSTANLLFGGGALRAGQHGDVVQRDGSVAHITAPMARPLTLAELALEPRLQLGMPEARATVRETAALFDELEVLARDRAVDVVLARVDATDTAAHLTFQELLEPGQDDAQRLLYGIYAYCDRRLGVLAGLLDDDDVLIVFSDHGTATAFEHDPRAMFIASGGGIAEGDAGTVDMSEIAGAFASLAGVDVGWAHGSLAQKLRGPSSPPR